MKERNEIGIMGGRFSKSIDNKIQIFPRFSWRNEFQLAKKYGFEKIEWVFDSLENPILDHDEINEMKDLTSKYNIKIDSLCADYFMDNLLFKNESNLNEKNLEILKNLIEKCYELKIKILEIPLVDQSRLTNKNDEKEFSKNLQKVIPIIEKYNIIINLETDLPPNRFKELIESFHSKNIKANYDVGNSTSLGYNIVDELNTLKDYIHNIHIKDRYLNGNTVPLGTGDVDFDLFFKTLKAIDYRNDLIIQGAREDESIISPIVTCQKYLNFVKQYVIKYLK